MYRLPKPSQELNSLFTILFFIALVMISIFADSTRAKSIEQVNQANQSLENLHAYNNHLWDLKFQILEQRYKCKINLANQRISAIESAIEKGKETGDFSIPKQIFPCVSQPNLEYELQSMIEHRDFLLRQNFSTEVVL